MLSWLRRRRERAERIAAKANALIRAFGVDAYSEARQRERRADSAATAQEWRHVALAIARRTGKKVGLDTATRMAVVASLSADCETGDPRRGAPASEPRALEELAAASEASSSSRE